MALESFQTTLWTDSGGVSHCMPVQSHLPGVSNTLFAGTRVQVSTSWLSGNRVWFPCGAADSVELGYSLVCRSSPSASFQLILSLHDCWPPLYTSLFRGSFWHVRLSRNVATVYADFCGALLRLRVVISPHYTTAPAKAPAVTTTLASRNFMHPSRSFVADRARSFVADRARQMVWTKVWLPVVSTTARSGLCDGEGHADAHPIYAGGDGLNDSYPWQTSAGSWSLPAMIAHSILKAREDSRQQIGYADVQGKVDI